MIDRGDWPRSYSGLVSAQIQKCFRPDAIQNPLSLSHTLSLLISVLSLSRFIPWITTSLVILLLPPSVLVVHYYATYLGRYLVYK
jgi:hypothetical protein